MDDSQDSADEEEYSLITLLELLSPSPLKPNSSIRDIILNTVKRINWLKSEIKKEVTPNNQETAKMMQVKNFTQILAHARKEMEKIKKDMEAELDLDDNTILEIENFTVHKLEQWLNKKNENIITDVNKWKKYEAPRKPGLKPANTFTDRYNNSTIFDGIHSVQNQYQLGIESVNVVPIAQGTINPTFRSTITRLVNIDSRFRTNILPFAGNDINHPSFNTNFTLDLSEPLTNVLSIKLHSIQIPTTWYTFDILKGNTCYVISPDASGGTTDCSCIPAGNYDISGLMTEMMNLSPNINITVSSNTGKITITPTPPAPSPPLFFTYYKTNGLGVDCSYSCSSISYLDQNLGWDLGFRRDLSHNSYIAVQLPATAEAPVDLYGPKTLCLSIDDFNQNRVNKGLISMSARPTKLAIPNYISGENISCGTVEPPLGTGTNLLAGLVVVPTQPRKLTQSQIYTANEIITNRKNPDLRIPPPTANNVMAVIPIANLNHIRGTPPIPGAPAYVLSGIDLEANKREYFGPVTIERLRIQLLDDKGNLLNLNGADWSFTLIIEQLYQY